MKSILRSLSAAVLLAAGACSTPPQPTVLSAVGPAPQVASNPDKSGYLLVYSAWSNFVDPGSTAHHSRYTITSDDGQFTREVINHRDRFDEGPLLLALAPGSYHVRARSSHFGRVTVPIVIQASQTTCVYLDGSAHPSTDVSQNSAVKLPDGEIVGWSSTSQHPTGP
ncbi:MAG TPA: hypothetical protein VKY92_13525 [Verrucomicrobiae bacterium]|nr:hypothetical protein [Verrucomicrobiae bacterium]